MKPAPLIVMSVIFEITEATIQEHIAAANSEDLSAGGQVHVAGLSLNFCIYKSELAWLTDEKGNEYKVPEIRDIVFAEWVAQML